MKLSTRVKADTSCNGLSATLEQLHRNDLRRVSFASRLLFVWAQKHDKTYVNGSEVEIITNQKALFWLYLVTMEILLIIAV